MPELPDIPKESAYLRYGDRRRLLPNIYCRKVVLENHTNPEDTKVTLYFELYQSTAALSDSNWLNNFNVLGANIYDSMYIEVIPFRHSDNIEKLYAGGKPLGSSINRSMPPASGLAADVGRRVFVKQQAGDGYLPRSAHPSSEAGTMISMMVIEE